MTASRFTITRHNKPLNGEVLQQKSGLVKSIDQNSGKSVTQQQPIPGILSAPPGNALLLRAYGIGVQIYTCPVSATSVAVPHANLIASDKDEGDIVAIHFAGPTWQALDGSSVVGDAACCPIAIIGREGGAG